MTQTVGACAEAWILLAEFLPLEEITTQYTRNNITFRSSNSKLKQKFKTEPKISDVKRSSTSGGNSGGLLKIHL